MHSDIRLLVLCFFHFYLISPQTRLFSNFVPVVSSEYGIIWGFEAQTPNEANFNRSAGLSNLCKCSTTVQTIQHVQQLSSTIWISLDSRRFPGIPPVLHAPPIPQQKHQVSISNAGSAVHSSRRLTDRLSGFYAPRSTLWFVSQSSQLQLAWKAQFVSCYFNFYETVFHR